MKKAIRIGAILNNNPSWSQIKTAIKLAAYKLEWDCRECKILKKRISYDFYYDYQNGLIETQDRLGWTDQANFYHLSNRTNDTPTSKSSRIRINITLPDVFFEKDEFRYQKRSKVILHATISVDGVDDDDYEQQYSEQLEVLKAFVSMFIGSANHFGTEARMKEIMANGDPDEILKCPIDQLGLSAVIETMLEAGQIETAGMLIEHSIKTLMEKFPGLGNDGVREIRDAIANHGLLLKADNGPI